MRKLIAVLIAVVCVCTPLPAQQIETGEEIASDDFERFTETTIQIGEAWAKVVTSPEGEQMDNLARGMKGALWIGYSSGNVNAPGVYLRDTQVADGVIELTVGPSTMGDRPHTSSISYRAPSGEAAANGNADGAYRVWLSRDWSGSRDVVLRYGGERLAAADIADSFDPQATFRVRVAFAGAHHVVSVDGETAIDFWDWHHGRESAGYVGFGGYYSQGSFDDFALHEATSDADGPVFDTSRGRIPPLVYQDRPFIPLGTYGIPGEEDTDEWLEAGGDCTIVPTFNTGLPREERLAQVRELAGWGAEHDVAMVYFPRVEMFSDAQQGKTITDPEEIPEKVELLNEFLSVTADHPNTLGYWTFDEPENQTFKAYGQWEERKDQGLAEWLAEGMRWTYETLKQGDPDAYVMPTIAWWTTYEGLAPLYDVNVPNTYAGGDKRYTVVYDCALAADAIRKTDAHSFVFMPPCYDILEGWQILSRPELRYSYIAPFTQGAMGILAWRLGRASMEYRRAVIYPVMREVDRLMPWLYGEWHDDRVTSDRDTATAEYLKELPTRVRLVPGEEDDEMTEVEEDVVPDVSHCLRRAADNTWLLIAVSNRREPLTVTFTLDIDGLPETALDMIRWQETPIESAKIVGEMEPFAVRAWRIVPE